MYYAILHNTGEVIASAGGLLECNDRARQISAWRGGVAPYYIAKEKAPGSPNPGAGMSHDPAEEPRNHDRS